MSDFIFSSSPQPFGFMQEALSEITTNACLNVNEYHGSWGSLVVSKAHYHGFDSIETSRYICVVIGGPVLYFKSNDFLGGQDTQVGTHAILEHWKTGKASWDEDLSGPFVILVVDKQTSQVECITDLMMFIPVYQYQDDDSIFWGTHIDALAKACGKRADFDEASLVDFVLHHAVTYPFTAYKEIQQCQPASMHRIEKHHEDGVSKLLESLSYWQPVEENSFENLDTAAQYLREGVQGYVDHIVNSLHDVAQFISAGEDSRSLAGMLPKHLERDAYIFLDDMNREGRVAKKVADAYGAHFKPDYRSKTHYLDILPEASDLVGSGHQYTHAHTLWFDAGNNLSKYRAVFGGYISDSLLKAQYANKPKWLRRLAFLPQIAVGGERRTKPVVNDLFSGEVLAEITRRRVKHFERVADIRPNSAQEWFELWPATMRFTIPNLYGNRRLFASYEIFMAKESVKVAASVPVSWKLNHRLFNKAFKPALKSSRFIPHADGRLPYYPWYINSAIQAPIWFYHQIAQRTGLQKKNQGPWADWNAVITSARWDEDVARFTVGELLPELRNALQADALSSNNLLIPSKVNFLQVCYQVHRWAVRESATPGPSDMVLP